MPEGREAIMQRELDYRPTRGELFGLAALLGHGLGVVYVIGSLVVDILNGG